jgi:D-tagatose-1,6-bisphosphate aldolase subunit GatZ/KbaZ
LIKYYIGPMSKNVVDAVIEFNGNFGFIPSRRQVDYNGGYVNRWTTGEFATYVNGRVPIERDHGGIGQGYRPDNGMDSYLHDSMYFDIVHIDPWRYYSDFESGLEETLLNMRYIYLNNPNVKFEVGTEESIRRFGVEELENLLRHLKGKLEPEIFENIEYAVVQSGVGLDLGKQNNTGKFDPDRLEKMIGVCKKFGKKSKEHNGDYLSNDEYKVRFDMGLDSINIAPEFGQLETLCYLDEMGDDIEDYYQICYESKRWEKWVDKDFVPEDNKRELIKICGHYVFSDSGFELIKPDIDDKIREVIINKLKMLT